jgi:hypothetical protein
MGHPFLGGAGDHVHYVQLASALAQDHGYALLKNGVWVPYVDSPPLYPFLLSLLMRMLGEYQLSELIEPFKVFNFGLYLLSVFLLYRFSSHQIRKPYPYLVTAVYALSPLTLSVACSVTSEMAYVVFSMCAVMTIDKYYSEHGSGVTRWHLFLCGLCLLAAVLTRNIGFSLILAFFLLSMRTLGTKRACVVVGTLLICLSPWFVREVYYRNYYPTEPVAHTEAPVDRLFQDPVEFVSHAFHNGEQNLVDATQNTLGSLDMSRFNALLVQKLHLDSVEFRFSDYAWVRWTLGILIAIGVFVGFYIGSGIGSLYLLVFILVAAVLAVDKQRYLMPIMPLMVYYLYLGLMRVGEWFSQLKIPISKVAVPVLTVLIAVNSLSGHLENLGESKLLNAYGEKSPDMEDHHGYLKALTWLKHNTAAKSEVVSHRPTSTYVYSGRKARRYPQKRKAKPLLEDLRQSQYILEEANVASVRQYLTPALRKNPQGFRLVYNDADANIRIWKVMP